MKKRPSVKGREKNRRVGVKPKQWVVATNTRIDPDLVTEIQAVYESQLFTQAELADWYGLSHATVNKIVNMKPLRAARVVQISGRRKRRKTG